MNGHAYAVAERFKSIHGEGAYAGTPMAFVRMAGCSVGKGVCTHCDTDFTVSAERGGGRYTVDELAEWVGDYRHICLTGGEPLDQDLDPLVVDLFAERNRKVHVETSGTKPLTKWMAWTGVWITLSPKPGWDERWLRYASEIKVVVGGIGQTPMGWPSVHDAVTWATEGRRVYLQPRMGDGFDLDAAKHAAELVLRYPVLRLSLQVHKMLGIQ